MKLPWFKKRHDIDDDIDDDDIDETNEPSSGLKKDRKIASVNSRLSVQSRLTNYAIGIAVCVFAGYMLYNYYANLFREQAAREDRTIDHSQTADTKLPPLKLEQFDQRQTQADQKPPPPAINQAPSNGQPPPETPAQRLLRERLESPVTFKMDSDRSAPQTQPGPSNNPSQAGYAGAGQPSGSGGSSSKPGAALTQSLESAQMDPVEAYSGGDPSLMVYQGTVIPCTVREAIDSSLVGQVECKQTEDLWSADHSTILAEAGTIYTGQQLTGLSRGNRRLPIVWVRGRTPMPNNVFIPLNSAATDELGRTGIAGEIDNHLAERFGPIVALSLIDDVGDYFANTGQSSDSSNNTSISLGNTQQGGQDLATEIFKEAANIPSTLTRNQGANIFIYVARDIDFSKIYTLEYKE